jgi:hypothetical protein
VLSVAYCTGEGNSPTSAAQYKKSDAGMFHQCPWNLVGSNDKISRSFFHISLNYWQSTGLSLAATFSYYTTDPPDIIGNETINDKIIHVTFEILLLSENYNYKWVTQPTRKIRQ